MEKEALKRIFEFLQEKGEHRTPFLWKWKNNIPLTKEDLNVQGDLDLSQVEMTSLPEGLKVGGDLYLMFSTISSLPEGLEVNGNLNLYKCVKLASLPEGLKVWGDLDTRYTKLKKYTNKELREMIKPGFIKGGIFR
jgi:hypothetical protein